MNGMDFAREFLGFTMTAGDAAALVVKVVPFLVIGVLTIVLFRFVRKK